jgi:hypothetical protein
MPNETPEPVKPKSPSNALWYGVTAFASALETTALHPLDTSTKRIQNNPSPFYSRLLSPRANLSAMSQVLFKEATHKNIFYKFASLYSGYPQALGYKFLQRGALALQPHLKKQMETYFNTQSYWIDLGSGMLIGGGEALFLLPIDYYKTLAQTREAASPQNTKSSFTAFGPTLARNIVFITTMSIVTDRTLGYLVRNRLLAAASKPDPKEPNDTQKYTARALGIGAATFSSSPLDVVKTRLQAAPATESSASRFEWGKTWRMGKDILSKEGPAAFLKGIVPKTLTQSARLTFFFGVQEKLLEILTPAEKPRETQNPAHNPAPKAKLP